MYINKKYANITPVEIYNIYDFLKNSNKEVELLKQTGNIDNIVKYILTCENTHINGPFIKPQVLIVIMMI